MSSSTTPLRGRRRGLIAGVAAAALLVVLGVLWVVGYSLTGSALPRDARVEGVAIGGLSRADAVATLRRELAERASQPLTVDAGAKTLKAKPTELGLAVDYEASVAAAGGAPSWNPAAIIENLTGGSDHEAVVTLDAAAASERLNELGTSVRREPADAALTIADGKPKLAEGVVGRELDVAATSEAIRGAYLGSTTIPAVVLAKDPDITTAEAETAREQLAKPALAKPITVNVDGKKLSIKPGMIAGALSFVPKDSKLEASLDTKKLDRTIRKPLAALGFKQPKDASIVLKKGKPAVVASSDGVGLDADRLAEAMLPLLSQADGRSLELDPSPLKAEFTTADAKALGVKEITGEFTTYFPASAYRVNNIGKSAGLVNNTLLKPGETFSMNRVLGPRTLARGWMAGGAIDGGKVVERMGGGISQTTTTTFNAIFFAGLEDIYHKPHSLYFSRYPLGREATLDYYSVDMKFRNNTRHGVLMQAFTNNPPVGGRGSVTVRVWSTKEFTIKASNPVRSNYRGPGPVIRDNSAVCTPQSAMSGFRVDYKRLFYQGKKLVKSEPFTWTYNSLSPRVCTNPDARRDRIER